MGRIKPLHKEMYSPERQEIERRAEYFELEARRHAMQVTIMAIASGCILGSLMVLGLILVLLAVL